MKLKKFFLIIEKGIEYLLAILLLIITFTIGVQVFLRYVVGRPLRWANSLATLSYTWLVFIGGAIAIRDNMHLKVDVVVDLFPKQAQYVIDIIGDLLMLLLSIMIILSTFYFMEAQIGITDPVLGIPRITYTISVAFGFMLVSIYLILRLIKKIFMREEYEFESRRDMLSKEVKGE